MADFQYEALSSEEQKSIIEARLVGLERDHLNVTLDVSAAGEGGNPSQEARLDALSKVITDLRARIKKLS